MTDRPLFRSVDAAFKWAFQPRYARAVQSSHILLPYMKKDRLGEDRVTDAPIHAVDPGLERTPIGLDAAAQAGMLCSFVLRQPDPRRLHLLSKYAHGELRQQARRALRDFLIPLMRQTIRPRFAIYECVSRHYGKRIVFKDLASKVLYLVPEGGTEAKRLQRAVRMVRELARDTDSWLKQISTQTEQAAHEQLKQSGVIG
jgi:hypothetical protein